MRPTFSFTCKGRGLTVLAASLSRGLLGLGAGRGLEDVLAVAGRITAVTTFLRFVTGSSMTSARGLKFSRFAVFNNHSTKTAGIADKDLQLRFCSVNGSTMAIPRLCFWRQRDQERYKLTKFNGHGRGLGLYHAAITYQKLVRLEPGPSSLVCRTPHASFRETFGERKPPHQQPVTASALFRPLMQCDVSRRDAHNGLQSHAATFRLTTSA